MARGRVAHAYILTGPRGVGKTTVARLLAKAVNCKNPVVDSEGMQEPCNECDACLDITSGNSMDFIEIDGASNNSVNNVRDLREKIKYAPASLKTKIYLIDEVHMLSQSAFNALLKTLEEPPDHAMFIFATTEAHKVPVTVLSRCQRFDFKRISTREIRTQLQKIVDGDKLQVDDGALVGISVKAEGGLRDALSMLDQLVAYQGDDPITEEVVRQALGLIGSEVYFRTTDMAASGDVSAALRLAENLSEGGHDPREFLRGLQSHTLRLLFLRAGGGVEELEVSEEDRTGYAARIDTLTDEELLRIGEWAAEAEDVLRDALDPQVRLELLLVRIARMDRSVDLGALLEKMGVEPSGFHQKRVRPTTSPATPASPPPAMSTPIPPAASTGSQAPLAKEVFAAEAPQPTEPPEDSPTFPEVDQEEQVSESPVEPVSEPVGLSADDPLDRPADAAEDEPQVETWIREASSESEEEPEAAPSPTAQPEEGGDEPPDEGGEDDDDGGEPIDPLPSSDLPGGGAPLPKPSPEPDEEEESTEVDTQDDRQLSLVDVRSQWLELCDAVNSLRFTLGGSLEKGAPTSLENGSLEVTFDMGNKFDYDHVMRQRDLVSQAFRAHFGQSKKIVVMRGNIPESSRPERRKTQIDVRREELAKALETRPAWNELVKRFELRLLDE